MKNLENNRIDYVISQEKQEKVKSLISELTKELDFTVGLNPSERMSLPKISKSNKLFVSDAVMAVKENDSILPGYLTVEAINADFTLFEQIDPIMLSLESLYNKVRDTQMLAGSEAYSSALMIYKMCKVASEAGIPGTLPIYKSLKERFSNQIISKDTEETNSETVSENINE